MNYVTEACDFILCDDIFTPSSAFVINVVLPLR